VVIGWPVWQKEPRDLPQRPLKQRKGLVAQRPLEEQLLGLVVCQRLSRLVEVGEEIEPLELVGLGRRLEELILQLLVLHQLEVEVQLVALGLQHPILVLVHHPLRRHLRRLQQEERLDQLGQRLGRRLSVVLALTGEQLQTARQEEQRVQLERQPQVVPVLMPELEE